MMYISVLIYVHFASTHQIKLTEMMFVYTSSAIFWNKIKHFSVCLQHSAYQVMHLHCLIFNIVVLVNCLVGVPYIHATYNDLRS